MTIQPISQENELKDLIGILKQASEVYLDTEADSLHHYFEKICLLQFSIPLTEGSSFHHALLDPLAGLELAPLFEVLSSRKLVFHGADYDLRMLNQGYGFLPAEIFDTMLAAKLAGHRALGLDALVLKYTGKTLDHASQKADWSKRPLSERLLSYAVEDTCHLPVIAQNLKSELESQGRLEWHRQQCAQLVEVAGAGRSRSVDDPWRIKGSFDMDRQKLAILKEIWCWRDSEARERDLPSFKICNNEAILQWVAWARANPHGDIQKIPKIPQRWSDRRCRAFKKALEKAWELPPEEWPEMAPRSKRPPFDPFFSKRITRLKTVRDACAKNIQLDPSILAPNAVLESISSINPKSMDELNQIERWLPWQKELLGASFLEALKQEDSLS